MKYLLHRTSAALAAMVATAVITIAGCKDSPTPPTPPPTGGTDSSSWGASIVANGSFATSLTTGRDIETDSDVPPWNVNGNSPQIVPADGCDGIKGVLQMWGNKTLGESVMQTLATPIKAGQVYRVSACVRFMDDNPDNYTRHVIVRFVAYNQPPLFSEHHWTEDRPNVAVIGSVKTSETTFTKLVTAEWTADADYTGFQINVENETLDNGTANTVSWAQIDDVKLQPKNDLY